MRKIIIYNTFSKKKEVLKLNKLIIYVCGVTVYDFCHIGHARIFIFFDIFVRILNLFKIKVKYIRNITDIDDKIISVAIKKKKTYRFISKFFIEKMLFDLFKLRLVEPTFEPKATSFISNIIKLISFLENNFYAYQGLDKDVYYDILKNPFYGMLSNFVLSTSKVGFKNLNVLNKKISLDFALWKNSIDFWASPWGFGRPGWHSECAAMSLYYSNYGIDIHSGGKDLLFPHHENECAQTYPLKRVNFVNIWMHVNHVFFDNEKMSKSIGNYIFIKDLLKKFNEEYLKFFFLFSHYRKPVFYNENRFIKTSLILNKIYFLMLKKKKNVCICKNLKIKFLNILKNDFNTPKVLFLLLQIMKKINKNKNFFSYVSQKYIFTLNVLFRYLGVLKYSPIIFLRSFNFLKHAKLIDYLIKKRLEARINKNWIIADNIRRRLEKMGVTINDNKIV